MFALSIYRASWMHGLRVLAVFVGVAAVLALHLAAVVAIPLLVVGFAAPHLMTPALWGLAALVAAFVVPAALGMAAQMDGIRMPSDDDAAERQAPVTTVQFQG
ncbi:MAG: hypothetical protein ABW042_07140 [Phenylobacterium sp.]